MILKMIDPTPVLTRVLMTGRVTRDAVFKFKFGCFHPVNVLSIVKMNTFRGDLTGILAEQNCT